MNSFADHFSRHAGAYASRRPHYPDELFDYLSSVSPRHELAWDCAAGSGQASIPLTRSFRRVIATDASGAMLAQAPPHPRVEYRVVPAECSGIETSSVDLVTVAQALHWLNIDRFYAEAGRVLVPGGILAVWTYGTQVLEDPVINHHLHTFYTDVVGPYWAAERQHVESGYRTLPFPYPEFTAGRFSMQERWTLPELVGYVGTWSATQSYRQATGRDPLERLESDLAAEWGNAAVRRRVCWSISLRIGARPA